MGGIQTESLSVALLSKLPREHRSTPLSTIACLLLKLALPLTSRLSILWRFRFTVCRLHCSL